MLTKLKPSGHVLDQVLISRYYILLCLIPHTVQTSIVQMGYDNMPRWGQWPTIMTRKVSIVNKIGLTTAHCPLH